MATYAIGDVHGCFRTLEALLEELPFDSERDRLWMVGDLVNRGPDSAEVLRWARRTSRELGDRFVSVLGNHEIHLLARALGADPRRRDTLDCILSASDRGELVDWVLHRPLLHREGDVVLVHAGLLPEWTADEAEQLAREVEEELHSPRSDRLLARYAVRPRRWRDGFSKRDRRDQALAAFTLLRTVGTDGAPRHGFTGPPWDAPADTTPWYDVPERRSADHTIVFGHWAALGLKIGPGLRALDTGCVWGERLTALRIEDGQVFQAERRPESEHHAASEPRTIALV